MAAMQGALQPRAIQAVVPSHLDHPTAGKRAVRKTKNIARGLRWGSSPGPRSARRACWGNSSPVLALGFLSRRTLN
eukprot:11165677-Lingulodinium_polyedra.AAC.1